MSKMWFYDHVYHVEYFASIEDFKSFVKEIQIYDKEYNEPETDAKCVFFEKDGKARCFIYVKTLDVPCIAHEAVHAAVSVFNKIGSKINLKTDECFAYYVQFLVGTIYHNYKKHKKRLKK